MRPFLCLIFLLLCLPACAAPPVGLDTLLRQETDLSTLPRLRDWTVRLDSSRAPDGGNDDAQHFVSMSGHTATLADLKGPGAVVRLWSANAAGQIKIYVDDSPTPVVDAPFPKLFDGSLPPFVAPLAQNAAGGFVSYLPIPYAKRCLITVDDPQGLYYQVNSVAFPPKTKVRSFALPLATQDRAALDAAIRAWNGGDTPSAARWTAGTIPDGPGERPLAWWRGPGVINVLRMQVPGADDAALRRLILRAYFDGHAAPDIEAPLSDFFGSAYGRLPFRSLLLRQGADGTLESRFPMPFGRSARFTLENGTGAARTVRLSADTTSRAFSARREGYFHARWSQEQTRRGVPHLWANVRGQRGHFVGVVQTMRSAHRGLGFLEGDEQIRVDAERSDPGKVPSTVVAPWNGTGTEDCFNGGWYFLGPIPRWLPLSAILVREDAGRIDTFRWFLNDAPVFQASLDAQIEHGGVNDAPGVYYSSVAFWYADGPAAAQSALPPAARIEVPPPLPPRLTVAGAIEGESLLDGAAMTGGKIQTQAMGGYDGDWSRDAQLWWTDAKPGDTLTLALPPVAPGAYDVLGYFTRAADYGRFRFAVGGQALPAELDAYHDGVAASGPLTLGRVTLPAGATTFQITVSGKNPSSTNTLFGLDALQFVKTP